MKKGFIKTAISAVVLGLSLNTAYAELENDRVIAKINGEEIKASDLLAYAKIKSPSANLQDPNIRQQLISAYVSRELLYQEALKKDLDKQELVQIALRNQRREVISQALVADILKNNPITDAELKQYYDKQLTGVNGNEYNVSHILSENEADAKKALARLEKGEDFAAVAKAVSTDSNAQNGGLVGWMHPSKLPDNFDDFANALKSIKPGTYGKTPVHTQFGWHIIKVNETRKVQPPAFENVKDQINALVLDQRIGERVTQLQKSAKIEIINK